MTFADDGESIGEALAALRGWSRLERLVMDNPVRLSGDAPDRARPDWDREIAELSSRLSRLATGMVDAGAVTYPLKSLAPDAFARYLRCDLLYAQALYGKFLDDVLASAESTRGAEA